MKPLPRHRVSLSAWLLLAGLLATHVAPADDRDRLKVGRQADGRIVVPTNQILDPAGTQALFPGRPVDLALIDRGRTLVVKNFHNLVFIETATGRIKRTLASPVGFGVVGLLPSGTKSAPRM